MQQTAGKAKKTKAVFWLLAITAVYFGICYLLILETKTCSPEDDKISISPNWFHGFWDRYLSCRQVNELGDALAGAFAPVAFLWLAGAVFIQSKELQAQREELNETQQVMRAQLDVAKQQVEETKASTALFKQQTELLVQQHEANEQERADREWDETVESLRFHIREADGVQFWGQYETGRHVIGFLALGPDNLPEDAPALMTRLYAGLGQLRKALVDLWNPDSIVYDENAFELVRVDLQELAELVERLSPAYQIQATNCGIDHFLEELAKLPGELDRTTKKPPENLT